MILNHFYFKKRSLKIIPIDYFTGCREVSGIEQPDWASSTGMLSLVDIKLYLSYLYIWKGLIFMKNLLCLKQPTGENGATRATICGDLQLDTSLKTKSIVLPS